MNDEENNLFKNKEAFSLKISMRAFYGRHLLVVIFGIISVALAWLGLIQGINSLINSEITYLTFASWGGLIIIVLFGFGLHIYFFGTRSKADFSENERIKAAFLSAFYDMSMTISTYDVNTETIKNAQSVRFQKLLETTHKKENLKMMISFLNQAELQTLLRIIKDCLQKERKSLKRYQNIKGSINLDVSELKLDHKIVSFLFEIIHDLHNKERAINFLSWIHSFTVTIFGNPTKLYFNLNIHRLQGFKDLQVEVIFFELQIPLKNGFPISVARNIVRGGECRIILDLNPESQNDSKAIVSIKKKLDGKSKVYFEIPLAFSDLSYETKLNYTLIFSGKAKEGSYTFSDKLYPILEGNIELKGDKVFKGADICNQKVLLERLLEAYPSS